MARKQKCLGNKGFSLVELIVVIAIMAVLVGVLAPTLIKNVEKSRESTDIQNLDTLRGAVTTALSDEGVFEEVGSGSVTLTFGTKGSESIASMTGNGGSATVTKLKAELTDTLKADLKVKSKQAKTGTLYVVISDGKVTALIGSDASTPIACAKLSGQNFESK